MSDMFDEEKDDDKKAESPPPKPEPAPIRLRREGADKAEPASDGQPEEPTGG